MKIKNSALFLIALVLVVSIFVYYRYAKEAFQSMKPAEVVVPTSKEVSAEVSYGVPGDKVDHLRFVVTVNKEGQIEGIRTLDAETGQIPEKKKAFNDEVNTLLKGKKLSDLGLIDKVAQASLTTDAFNTALPKLQAAL